MAAELEMQVRKIGTELRCEVRLLPSSSWFVMMQHMICQTMSYA